MYFGSTFTVDAAGTDINGDGPIKMHFVYRAVT